MAIDLGTIKTHLTGKPGVYTVAVDQPGFESVQVSIEIKRVVPENSNRPETFEHALQLKRSK